MDYYETPNWHKKFHDSEVTCSLHRWTWLLHGLTEEDTFCLSREEGLYLIRSWLQYCSSNIEFNKDAYSNAERIVNASIFLLKTGDKTIPQDIQDSIKNMGLNIARNLEYYDSNMTGNHAFNNARVFFVGVLTGLPNAVKLASEIIKERLPRLVSNDGFFSRGIIPLPLFVHSLDARNPMSYVKN